MAQTTSALPRGSYQVELSDDNSTWIDVSGSTTTVSGMEQARKTGETYTAQGDAAIITSGKREPLNPTHDTVYTETSGESFETVRAYFEAGTPVYVRYSPLLGASGAKRYFSSNGEGTAVAAVISNFSYFEFESDSGDSIASSYDLMFPALTSETVA